MHAKLPAMTGIMGMKWYICLSAASLESRDHDWPGLLRAALRTARANTTLRPYLLWDGDEHPFLDELRGVGVSVIHRRVPFYAELAAGDSSAHWLAIAAGAYLRVEIPMVEMEDGFVLYTDADVMFLRDPVPALRQIRPRHFAACPEFRPDDGLNSGVMLLNVKQMRQDYPAFIRFIRAHQGAGLDQEMYRRFYDGKWELMPLELNWKPYWGVNERAHILHWHGIKPVVVRRLLDDPQARTFPELQRLVEMNPAGYRHYLGVYEGMNTPLEALPPAPPPRLGIAVTTFNRRALVMALVAALRELTLTPFELVVCDDGSTDGTAEVLRAAGVRVIAGGNKGIAWNKNRGLYYLLHVADCDVVLLLDDDIEPVAPGWEREWIEAVERHGHVNHVHPAYRHSVAAGLGSAEDPVLTGMIPGWALGFSKGVLAQIGYFDPRFGRYGHEHSDLSFRAVRAGFGGITLEEEGRRTLFFAIEGGLAGVPSQTSGTQDDLATNARLLAQSGKEPLYRHAWRDDNEMALLLDEIATALPGGQRAALRPTNRFATLQDYLVSTGQAEAMPAAPRTGLISLGRLVTRGATPGEVGRPWWRVDLGGIATIREIHVHASGGAPQARVGDFALEASIDGESWVELARASCAGPYIWAGPGTAWARHVRVAALGGSTAPLDRVDVYGDLP